MSLPTEIWQQVALCTTCVRLRCLCSCFHAFFSLRKLGLTTDQLSIMVNLAAWEGKVEILEWVLETWQLQLNGQSRNCCPVAFALEWGHLSFLKHVFTGCGVSLNLLDHMCVSLPVAMYRGHFDTVAWVAEKYRQETGAEFMSLVSLDKIQSWLQTRNQSRAVQEAACRKVNHFTNLLPYRKADLYIRSCSFITG